MRRWVARRLCDACSALELDEQYSGRGMFGETTSAVTGTIGNFAYAVGRAAQQLSDDLPEVQEQLMSAVQSVRTDSMGREVVFY